MDRDRVQRLQAIGESKTDSLRITRRGRLARAALITTGIAIVGVFAGNAVADQLNDRTVCEASTEIGPVNIGFGETVMDRVITPYAQENQLSIGAARAHVQAANPQLDSLGSVAAGTDVNWPADCRQVDR